MSFRYFPARVALQLPLLPPLTVPSIALPLTRPVYCEPPAVKLILSPFSLPEIGVVTLPFLSVPVIILKVCLRFSSPCGSFHVPPTFAGTIQRCAVHQWSQPLAVAVSSAFQSSMSKEFDTMRVPGLRSRIFGRSFVLILGSRNMVMTCAWEKSVSNRSALTKLALSLTPSLAALRFDSSTISGLYSMPRFGAALRGGDYRAPVAGAKIDHVIFGCHFRHVEHLVDQRLGCRHPHHIFP